MEGIWYPFFGNLSQSEKISEIKHGPLLLDRTVYLPLFAMWPSFGYFSTVI